MTHPPSAAPSAALKCVICHDRLVRRFCCGQHSVCGAFCQHVFHEECIAEWLAIQNSCPICREPFTSVELESSDITGGWVENDRCLLCDAAMGDSHGATCDFYGIVGALVEGEPTQSTVIRLRLI